MKPTLTVRVGGLALVVGAIAFMAVFSFLAARFDYPAILDGTATAEQQLIAVGASPHAVTRKRGTLVHQALTRADDDSKMPTVR